MVRMVSGSSGCASPGRSTTWSGWIPFGKIARPDGEGLRRRIDEMGNEEYQVLIRKPGQEARSRLLGGAPEVERDALARVVADVPDEALPAILADLGGHDIDEIVRALDAADRDTSRPAVVFAYTVKGWRLPFAGDALNQTKQHHLIQ